MRHTFLAGLLLTVTACTPAPAAVPAEAPPTDPLTRHGVVTGITDGDTVHFHADNGAEEQVRPIGIDTPETKDPRLHGRIECGGVEATAYATRVLLDQPVTLVTDPTQGTLDTQTGNRVDVYKRTLAYIELDDVNPAGSDYSVMAADAGVAHSYIYDPRHPPRRIGPIQAAESRARAARRGFWGSCP